MPPVIKRVQYFDHQFLQVADFTDEQTYHRETIELHNANLHTPGVADGLDVTFDSGSTKVTVAPGVALDSNGMQIVLANSYDLELASFPTGGTVYVVISYAEQSTDPASDGSGNNTRWTETPDIEGQTALPTDQLHLVLASVTRNENVVTAVDTTVRSLAGAVGGDLVVNALTLQVGGAISADWPTFTGPSASLAELNSALTIEGALTAASATISGALTAASASVNGALHAGSATLSGPLTVPSATLSGALTATNANVSGMMTAGAAAVNGVLNVQGDVIWGTSGAFLSTDQGGSLELGAGNNLDGAGTPYIDFHSANKAQDYNLRVINDGDGQLTVTGQPGIQANNRLSVLGETGIRQQRLYMSGGTSASTWSSISFNACHGPDANGNPTWRFPDITHPAVTVEIDAAGVNGDARFEIYTTTKEATQTWIRRLGIDGEAGYVTTDTGLMFGNGSILYPDQGGAIELGGNNGVAGSGTPYIDFHFHNGVVQDYNARIINSGDGVLVIQGQNASTFAVNVQGHVNSTNPKFFSIDHPLDASRSLVHAALEGPEAGVFYRGEGRLEEGRATIELPSYFEALCRADDRTVLVTPKVTWDHNDVGVLGATPVSEGKFTVIAGSGTDPNQEFYWEVKGVRGDIDRFEVEPIRGTTPQSPQHEPMPDAT